MSLNRLGLRTPRLRHHALIAGEDQAHRDEEPEAQGQGGHRPGFGDRLVSLVVPYVDAKYRTLPDAGHRAVGGLSRGGGWAIHMALTQYRTFGIVGLHSPVIFDDDAAMLDKLFASFCIGK